MASMASPDNPVIGCESYALPQFSKLQSLVGSLDPLWNRNDRVRQTCFDSPRRARLHIIVTPQLKAKGGPSGSPEENTLIKFLLLTFSGSWSLWFGATRLDSPALQTAVVLFGVFMPGIVAIGLTWRAQGAAGLGALVRRLVKANVAAGWYAFALLYIVSVKLLVAVLIRVQSGDWPRFGDDALPLMLAATIGTTLLGGQVGEELGWRGYALPRLADRFGLALASLVLGVIWAAWHLPLFFILSGDTVGQSFPFYLLQVTAVSVTIAWLYMKTGGSLLLTMLLHAAVNNTKDIVPSAVPGATNVWALHATPVGSLTLALLWIGAAWFLYDMRGEASVAGSLKSH